MTWQIHTSSCRKQNYLCLRMEIMRFPKSESTFFWKLWLPFVWNNFYSFTFTLAYSHSMASYNHHLPSSAYSSFSKKKIIKKSRFYLIKPNKNLTVTRPDPTSVTRQFNEEDNSWLCLEEQSEPEELHRSLLTWVALCSCDEDKTYSISENINLSITWNIWFTVSKVKEIRF